MRRHIKSQPKIEEKILGTFSSNLKEVYFLLQFSTGYVATKTTRLESRQKLYKASLWTPQYQERWKASTTIGAVLLKENKEVLDSNNIERTQS